MDSIISRIFGVSILRVPIDKLLEPINFPGNHDVCAILGRDLVDEIGAEAAKKWSDVQRDVFVCAEEALDALGHISKLIPANLTVAALYEASGGCARRVHLTDIVAQSGGPEVDSFTFTDFITFVPLTLLLGKILQFSHNLDVPNKLRISNFVTYALQKALGLHPKLGHASVSTAGLATASSSAALQQGAKAAATEPGDDDVLLPPFDRFHELGVTPEEFEASQVPKYKEAYERMRSLIPPNITKSSLKNLLADGMPRPLAKHIWETKILWLLCMHPQDLPKIHIADLRGKYQFHGLDIAEMRALHYWLPKWKGDSVKAEWRTNFKSRLDKLVSIEIFGSDGGIGSANSGSSGSSSRNGSSGDDGGSGVDEGKGEVDDRQSLEMRHACYQDADEEGYYDLTAPLRRIYLHREKPDKPDKPGSKEHRHHSPHHRADEAASDGEDQGDLHYSNVEMLGPSPSGRGSDRASSPRDLQRKRADRHGKPGISERERERRSHTHSHHSKLEANLAMLDSPASAAAPRADSPGLTDIFVLRAGASRGKSKSISLPLSSADYTADYSHASTLLQDDDVAAIGDDVAGWLNDQTALNTQRNLNSPAAAVSTAAAHGDPRIDPSRARAKPAKRLSFKQKDVKIKKASSDDADDEPGATPSEQQHKMDLWSESTDPLSSPSAGTSAEAWQGVTVSRQTVGADGVDLPGSPGSPRTPKKEDVARTMLEPLPPLSTLGSARGQSPPSARHGYANGAGPLNYLSRLSPSPGHLSDRSVDFVDDEDESADPARGVGLNESFSPFSLASSSEGHDDHQRHLVYQTEFHDMFSSSAESDSADSTDFADTDSPESTPTRPAQRPIAPLSHWMQSFLASDRPKLPLQTPDGEADPKRRASDGQFLSSSSLRGVADIPVYMREGSLQGTATVPWPRSAPSSASSSAGGGGVSTTTLSPVPNEYASNQKRPSWYTQGLAKPSSAAEDADDEISEHEVESEFRDEDYDSETSTYTATETGSSYSDDSEEDSEERDEEDYSDDEDEDEDDEDDDEGDSQNSNDSDDDNSDAYSDEDYEEYLRENGSYLSRPPPQPRGKGRRRDGRASQSSQSGSSATHSSSHGGSVSGGDSKFTSEMFAALASVFGDSKAEAKMTMTNKPRASGGVGASRRGMMPYGSMGSADSETKGVPLLNPEGFAFAGRALNSGLDGKASDPKKFAVTPSVKGSPFWSEAWNTLSATEDSLRRRVLTPEEQSAEKMMEDEIDMYVPVELGAEWEDGSTDDSDEQGAHSEVGSIGGEGDFWRVSGDEDDLAKPLGRSLSKSRLAQTRSPTLVPTAPAPALTHEPLSKPLGALCRETQNGTWSDTTSASQTQTAEGFAGVAASARVGADLEADHPKDPAIDAESMGDTVSSFASLTWQEGDWGSNVEDMEEAVAGADPWEAEGAERVSAAPPTRSAGQYWEMGDWSSGDGLAGPDGGVGVETSGAEAYADLPLEEIVLYGDARHVRSILFHTGATAALAERPRLSADQATALLQRCSDQTDELLEPLETFMLLVDDLKADVNAVNAATGNAPLHSIFNNPLLGRFLVSRGADVLLRDANGDSPLSLCIEYDYDYILPAFVAVGGETSLIDSGDEARLVQYASTLLLGGYGVRVGELCAAGDIKLAADVALELLAQCRSVGFDSMKEPVETFELLERIVLED